MICKFCLCYLFEDDEVELYFYSKSQLEKFCKITNKKFYFDYFDEENKVKYYKTVV